MVIVQYDDGTRPVYTECIEQVKRNMPSGCKHKLITHCGYDIRNNDYRCASEIVRLKEACVNPDMVWLDSDCLIKKWPDFDLKPGRPYMAKRWHEAIFFVNGACDVFKSILYDYNKSGINTPCWLKKLFLDHRKEFELLPHGYIEHIAMSRAVKVDNFKEYSNDNYKLYRDQITGELKLDIKI